jgi:hypothetical protein
MIGAFMVFPFIYVAFRPLQKRSASFWALEFRIGLFAELFGNSRNPAKAATHIVSWIDERRFNGRRKKGYCDSNMGRALSIKLGMANVSN